MDGLSGNDALRFAGSEQPEAGSGEDQPKQRHETCGEGSSWLEDCGFGIARLHVGGDRLALGKFIVGLFRVVATAA